MMDLIVPILKEFGLPIVLVVFFVWRDWKREISMAKRLKEQEDKISSILTTTIKESTTAIVKNSEVLSDLVELLKRIPCLPCVMVEKKVEKKNENNK